ncbi:MAG: glucosamine-6-phosphate deaminase [Firmicutes bacterium]|nr:glucosamine-6-phosphate deaminase [Bacillota bacterium]
MKTMIFPDHAAMSRYAAQMIADQVRANPASVLGLATGSTPEQTYEELVKIHREENLSFAQVTTFNLDEYWGLAGSHPASYRYYMQERLFNYIDIPLEQTHIPRGDVVDAAAECARYEELLATHGPVDLQILGIGTNAHIGFNEPGTEFGSTTHLVDLTQDTIEANSRFFSSPDDVPKQAISMGIKSIMQARQIVLMASGSSKADAVAKSIQGPVTPEVPASVLQLHPNCIFLLDEAAAAGLK